jgi:hypothetical protein
MSSNKVNKKRGHSTNGRGYKKHKSGAKGGVGRAGIWSHNKNARKFRTVEVRNFDHYIQSKILLDLIEHLKTSESPSGDQYLFRAGGKVHALRTYDVSAATGTFVIDDKFKKVMFSFKKELIPITYGIIFRRYVKENWENQCTKESETQSL